MTTYWVLGYNQGMMSIVIWKSHWNTWFFFPTTYLCETRLSSDTMASHDWFQMLIDYILIKLVNINGNCDFFMSVCLLCRQQRTCVHMYVKCLLRVNVELGGTQKEEVKFFIQQSEWISKIFIRETVKKGTVCSPPLQGTIWLIFGAFYPL